MALKLPDLAISRFSKKFWVDNHRSILGDHGSGLPLCLADNRNIESPFKLWSNIENLLSNDDNDGSVSADDNALRDPSGSNGNNVADKHNEGFIENIQQAYGKKRPKTSETRTYGKRTRESRALESSNFIVTSRSEDENDQDTNINTLNEAFVEPETETEPISSQYTSSLI